MRQNALLSLLGYLATTTFAHPIAPQAAFPEQEVLHEETIHREETVLREQRFTNHGSIKGARVPPDAIIPLRIGLRQQNLDRGYEYLMDISDPSSERYGKHWTQDEVYGINETHIMQTVNRGWLAMDIPAWQAERLMSTEYHEYEMEHDGTLRIGCDRYRLPAHITDHVDYIKPGITFSPPLKKHTFQRIAAVDGAPKLMAPAPASPLAPFPNVTHSANTTTNGTLTQNLTNGTLSNNNNTTNVNNTLTTNNSTSNVTLLGNGAATRKADFLSNCGSSITPACLRALYHIPRISHADPSRNELGVFEAGGAYAQEDLDLYFATYLRSIPRGTHPVLAGINGGRAPVAQSSSQGESVIDLDIMFALTYPETITLYQVNNPGIRATEAQFENEVTFMTPFLDAIDGSFCTDLDRSSGLDCGTDKLTKVLSVSYIGLELAYGEAAQKRTCSEIMKLGLRGHTVIFASGDYGVAGFPKSDTGYNGCVTRDLKINGPSSGPIFNPTFPSNCPYVLSVGATKLDQGQTAEDAESVMDFSQSNNGGFSSAGGFSNYFPRPSYQKTAVQNYLNNHMPQYRSYQYNGNDRYSGQSNIGANGGIYNRNGRAYPDVSANGASFTTYVKGKKSQYLGTSLAAPIWASIISLINEERARSGKGAVGFVHPVLYQHPEAFNDITTGSNPGCGTEGFPASEGWDASTGLGTPNFPALLRLFSSLP